MIRWLACAVWLVSAIPALAAERLFTGQVQSVVLQPSGVGQCTQPCAQPGGAALKDGVHSVCISNMGGCQNAVVKVLVDHVGAEAGQLLEFPSRTGEWGELNFPVTSEPILVYARDGVASWAPIIERSGQVYIQAAALRRPGQFPLLQSLPRNANGEIPLAALLSEFAKARVGRDQAMPLRP